MRDEEVDHAVPRSYLRRVLLRLCVCSRHASNATGRAREEGRDEGREGREEGHEEVLEEVLEEGRDEGREEGDVVLLHEAQQADTRASHIEVPSLFLEAERSRGHLSGVHASMPTKGLDFRLRFEYILPCYGMEPDRARLQLEEEPSRTIE